MCLEQGVYKIHCENGLRLCVTCVYTDFETIMQRVNLFIISSELSMLFCSNKTVIAADIAHFIGNMYLKEIFRNFSVRNSSV